MDSRPRGPKTAYYMEGNFIGPNYFTIRVNSDVGLSSLAYKHVTISFGVTQLYKKNGCIC
jgi:hypothetical protein